MMLLSLGMGSEFGTIEGFTASIYDLEPFPMITRRKWLVSGNALLWFYDGLFLCTTYILIETVRYVFKV